MLLKLFPFASIPSNCYTISPSNQIIFTISYLKQDEDQISSNGFVMIY